MAPLTQLLLIWTSVLLAIGLAERTRMTPVLWYLFMGAALVNLGLLPVESDAFISGFAELGIIVIMFALGFEENIERFLAMAKRSWGIAFFGAAAPFLTAWGFSLWMWGDHNIALMCGLAMTATAVSLTMVSLRSERLQDSPAATAIMASAVMDDLASLALVAILVPIALGEGSATVSAIAWTVLKAVAFFAVVALFSAWFFPHDLTKGLASKVPLLRQYGIRHLIQIGEGLQASLVMLLVAISLALIGKVFGFHPAVGAYMAGLVLKEEYFLIHDKPSRSLYMRTKHVIDDVAFTWIGPVFFVDLGSRLLFDKSLIYIVAGPALLLFAAIFIAQVLSASLAARYTGRFLWNESLMVGFGMIGRAELAFVVMGIAYVQYHIITTEVFYTLMLTAFLLNCSVPVVIRWWKPFCTGERTVPAWMRGSRSIQGD